MILNVSPLITISIYISETLEFSLNKLYISVGYSCLSHTPLGRQRLPSGQGEEPE